MRKLTSRQNDILRGRKQMWTYNWKKQYRKNLMNEKLRADYLDEDIFSEGGLRLESGYQYNKGSFF